MITISLMDVMLFILALAGLVVLIFFILVLKNILAITKQAKGLMDDKKKEIDSVIDELPILMNNINDISARASMLVDDVNEIVIRSKDDVTGIVASVNRSMDDVNKVTGTVNRLAEQVEYTADNVGHSVNSFTDNMLDASRFFSNNKENIIDYIFIFKDYFDELRRIFFGRR